LAQPASAPPCPAYLLGGEDLVARAERLEELVAELLDPGARAFNLDRLSAREADPSTLATLLETPPLLGSARVVVLDDVESASAGVERAVERFLEAPSPSTCLVALVTGRPSGRPWTGFRQAGSEEIFEPPRGPAALRAWIEREVRRRGKEIEPRAAALLAELHGEGTAGLVQEVAKVLAHAGERPRVFRADVEAVAVSAGGGDKYLFVDLVAMGRREAALAELHALLEAGESPIYLVTLLAQHFLFLGGIRACEARGLRGAEAIARALGKPAWLLDRRNPRVAGHEPPRAQARRYDRAAVDRWLAGLLQLDLALKSSRLPAAALMEETILRLMSVAPAAA
jgi:DNA polymerase III delta subunit